MTVTTSERPRAAATVDPDAVVSAIRAALRLPPDHGFVALHEPSFEGAERDYVTECIDTGWVSSVGSYVEKFEQELAFACGAAHAVAVVNGTAALQVALQLAGVGPGDEVLMPALTFVATANAAAYLGAVPHFVDSETRTFGLDPAALGDHLAGIAEVTALGCHNRLTGRRIAAVVPMHVYGHPVDMDPLLDIAVRYGIRVVEDAAEAVGSLYYGRPCGSLGRLAAVSFNGNKIVTTGGGGAILTDDAELAARARHLTTTAKVPHRWAFDHDELGYNFRMPNLNAALGCAQLEQLPSFVARKRALAERYAAAFETVPGVGLFHEPAFARSNYWLNCLLLDDASADARDALLEATNGADLMTRPTWRLMCDLPMYADCPKMDLSTARDLEHRIVNLPSSVSLGGVS